jgi:hypothetical protein
LILGSFKVLAPAALALYKLSGGKCALRIFHLTTSIPGIAPPREGGVYFVKKICNAHFTLNNLYSWRGSAARERSLFCKKKCAKRIFHLTTSIPGVAPPRVEPHDPVNVLKSHRASCSLEPAFTSYCGCTPPREGGVYFVKKNMQCTFST